MNTALCIFLGWLTFTYCFIVILPTAKAKLVTNFIKMVLTLLPLSAMIRAWKNGPKKEK